MFSRTSPYYSLALCGQTGELVGPQLMDLLLTTTSFASAICSTLAVVAATTSRRRSSGNNASATSSVCSDRFLKGQLGCHNRVLINGMGSS